MEIPSLGQLLYRETLESDGKLKHAQLVFIDTEIEEGKGWNFTQIALIEDQGNGLEAWTGFEAGIMAPKYTRLATDEDIMKFIKLIKEGKMDEFSSNLEKWLGEINLDITLLPSEKERINTLAK